MKLVIVSDIHGATFEPLEELVLKIEKPDVVIVLGDFDQTRSIQSLIDLSKRYKVMVIPGNHDHAVFYGEPIYSRNMQRQGKDYRQLHSELMADPVSKDFLEKLLQPESAMQRIWLDQEKYVDTYPTLLVHAGLAGNLRSYPDCPQDQRHLWYRLTSEGNYEDNFLAMKSQRSKVMVRGHDATSVCSVRYFSNGDPTIRRPTNKMVRILPDKDILYTITVGDYIDGNYAVIDTRRNGEEYPILRFEEFSVHGLKNFA